MIVAGSNLLLSFSHVRSTFDHVNFAVRHQFWKRCIAKAVGKAIRLACDNMVLVVRGDYMLDFTLICSFAIA